MDHSDAVIVQSSRLKSVVWNDFDKFKKGDTFVAICRHCKKKLNGSSTCGTSHLRNHLIRCQRRATHGIAQFFSAREMKKEGTVTLASLPIDQELKMVEPQLQPLSIVSYKVEQEDMKDYPVINAKGNLDQRRSQFDLARMIILHGYPLGMVEHVGFRVFVKNLQPLFELSTSDRVVAHCMEIYAIEKQRVYEFLDKLPGKISLSADMWSTSGHGKYLCLTAHYIDETWQLRKKLLSFIMINPLAEMINSEDIMTCLMDWDIDRKLFSMTFDNYSVYDEVVHIIRERLSQNRFLYSNGLLFDIRCATNLVNMMVHDALEAILETTQKIRESIKYVKNSHLTRAKFNEIATEAGIDTQKCLFLDNMLRWDSTYFMLQAAMEYKGVFSLLQGHDSVYAQFPSDLEWERVNIITGYLKPFFEVTDTFTKSMSSTANIYFSELCEIHLQLIAWCKNSDNFVSSVAVKMKSKFDNYWEKCNLALVVAAMLDPRYKMKFIEYYYAQLFGNGSSELIDEVFEYIKTLFNEHSIASPLASVDQGLASEVNGGTGNLPNQGKHSMDRLMGFDKFLNETSQDEALRSDLDKYLEEPLFPRSADFNILDWWKVHTPRYPVLSMMAQNILAIPMSKVTPDFAFNAGGRVLNRDWCSLEPSTVQALMCSQDWMRGVVEN